MKFGLCDFNIIKPLIMYHICTDLGHLNQQIILVSVLQTKFVKKKI